MLRFVKIYPWFTIVAGVWALACIYLFCLIIFFRIVYADGLYWFDTNPPRAIPAWFYIPQHIILYSPLLLVGVLPFVLKYKKFRDKRCEPKQR
jgi:hypothetical protein